MAKQRNFIHLHLHSHYSLLDGLAKIDDIITRAKELKMPAVALTDHGNLYGAVEFYRKAKKAGIKPILGVEAYMSARLHTDKDPRLDAKRFHLTLLAKNLTGWKNLLKLVTKSYLEGFYYKPRIDKNILSKYHEGLICLSGCPSGEIAKFLAKGNYDGALECAKWYKETFGDDFYLEIQQHMKDLKKDIIKLGGELKIKIVATQDIHYIHKDDKTAHEVLLAVQTNSKLDDEDRLTLKNYDISFSTQDEMYELFKDMPEVVDETMQIFEKCNVEFDLNKIKIPEFPLPEGEKSPFEYLKK